MSSTALFRLVVAASVLISFAVMAAANPLARTTPSTDDVRDPCNGAPIGDRRPEEIVNLLKSHARRVGNEAENYRQFLMHAPDPNESPRITARGARRIDGRRAWRPYSFNNADSQEGRQSVYKALTLAYMDHKELTDLETEDDWEDGPEAIAMLTTTTLWIRKTLCAWDMYMRHVAAETMPVEEIPIIAPPFRRDANYRVARGTARLFSELSEYFASLV